jgi:hypothetical protein
MQRISIGLWLALAAAVLQLVSIGSNYYSLESGNRSAWFGIPHAAELLLVTALLTIVLLALAAADRSPLKGRNAGALIAVFGLLSSLHIGYRMVLPPFGGCLTFFDCSSAQASPELLVGIYIALIGSLGVLIGGLAHAFSKRAKITASRPPIAAGQEGMSPWLGLAALGALGQFVFGYTVFSFYNTGDNTWSGWIATPHTSVLVLVVTVAVIGLAVAAARGRAPMGPAALGGTIAALGFVSGSRILFRILTTPFSSGPAENAFQGSSATIELGGYLSLAFAVVLIIAGIVQAAIHQEPVSEAQAATGAA